MPRHALAAIAMVAALIAAPAAAEPPDEAGRLQIRSTILGQIEAFRQDDPTQAFSFASASIRQMFATPDRFMAMVRISYPQVYRPRDVAFGRLIEADDTLLQEVFVIGPAGKTWVAAYEVVRQDGEDGWRINGVLVVPDRKAEPI